MKQKGIDLSTRQLPPLPNTIPSFTPVNHATGSLVFSGAGVLDLFAIKTACTVRRVVIQLNAAATLQLLVNNEPASVTLNLPANALVGFPGLFLPNNARLQILSTAAVTVFYDVVYIIGVHNDQIGTDLHVSGLTVATSPALQNVNLTQQNSVALSSPIADAPVGTEIAPVSRIIPRKKTIIETTTPLAANAIFTGAWHDSELDGTAFVMVQGFSPQAGATLAVDVSDDTSNANMTISSWGIIGTPSAGITWRLMVPIFSRYWRVRYINGVTLQASFELTSCSIPFGVGIGTSTAGVSNGSVPIQVLQGTSGQPINDNDTSTGFKWPLNNATNAFVASPILLYGGAFSGTANAALQGWSKPRTPTIFKQVSTAATGSTAIWTPGSGNKFRLLGFRIQVTGLAKAAAAADLKIALLDAAADLGQSVYCTIQTTALTVGGVQLDTGWISLGQFGVLSSAANNVLNLNLSFALTGGLVNVTVQGTEE